MPLRDLVKLSSVPPTTQWQALISEANKALWNQDIKKAAALYAKVNKAVRSKKPDTLDAGLLNLYLEARLGLWAVAYLSDPRLSAGYLEILANQELPHKLWFFIARVFAMKGDTRPEALHVYKNVLRCKPTETNANIIRGLLESAGFSEEAFDLFKTLGSLLPEDLGIALQCCRWAVKANRLKEAELWARRITDRQPDHVEANRFWGYLAESQANWSRAAHYYAISQDWLRQAVCLNHQENYAQALVALEKVSLRERKSYVWLYHAGWANYQSGNPTAAGRYWQTLRDLYPDLRRVIDQQQPILERKADYPVFERTDIWHQVEIPEQLFEDYKTELLMRTSAVQLFLKRNPQAAEEKFRQVAARSPKNPLPSIYLLTAAASQKTDLLIDKVYAEKLQKFYGNAGLYFFFRGLWLAPIKPMVAQRYIEKAVELNLSQYIPSAAAASLQWLLRQWSGGGKDAEQLYASLNLTHPDPESNIFYQAIAPSILLYQVKSQDGQNLDGNNYSNKSELVSPNQMGRLKSIIQALDGSCVEAITRAQQEQDSNLEQAVISLGVTVSLRQKKVTRAVEIVSIGKKRYPDDSQYQEVARRLQEAMPMLAWQNKDYAGVIQQLEEKLPSESWNTEIHHTLALFYTRWALEQGFCDTLDHAERRIDLWKYAIGHWAVALTDKRYWTQWKKQRNPAYEAGLEEINIGDLVNERIPGLLKSFFNEQESQANAARADDFHAYSVLLEQELDIITALRRLIMKAEKARVHLPKVLRTWLSPTLIKEHGGKEKAKELTLDLAKLGLSQEDERLLKLAFSRLGEVVHLASSGKFTQALSTLEAIEKDQEISKNEQQAAEEERITILENYVDTLIKSQRWQKAKERAAEGIQLNPQSTVFEKFYLDACLGFANACLRDENSDLEAAAKDLKAAKTKLKQGEPEINALLAEVLVELGFRDMRKENKWSAEQNFTEALALSASNLRAKEGMAWVYFEKTVESSEKGYHRQSFDHAKTMYKYSQTSQTANAYARAAGRYAIYLAEKANYQAAVDLLFSMADVPFDPGEVDLVKLLASILVDQGANLYNSGRYAEGIKATQMALQLDPDNENARKNLRITSRGW